jgi:TIR domain
MRRIDEITISDDGRKRTISFWEGNPADLGHDRPVDLIIVSAFRNNYVPTRWSIIGALHRKGLSVAELALNKAVDLRDTTGFWISPPLAQSTSPVGVGRILCFEPHFLSARATEVVGHLFRGLFPFLPDDQDTRVAMAVIATGALGEEPSAMLRALVSAASVWMQRGLPISELMIMEQNPSRAKMLAPVFAEFRASLPREAERGPDGHDFFLSFAEEDAIAVDTVRQALSVRMSHVRLFDYRFSVDPGKVWQDAIDRAMRSCRHMIAFLSPYYFMSVECKEEMNMARLRNKREDYSFLYPLYVRSLQKEGELPLWLQAVSYVDCREVDEAKLTDAAGRLAAG